MKFADLHLHTSFSDGTYSPQELIRQSSKVGLAAIAVVDHDSVEGIEPTAHVASAFDIEVVPGIELSAEYEGSEIHILGYFVDYTHAGFLQTLQILKKNREERVYKIIDKLSSIGVTLAPEAVFSFAGAGTVGRLHVARALVKHGKVGSIGEAFQRYLGDNCPAFVLGFKFSPLEAIELIKAAGGIPVLAHPYTLHNDDMLNTFIDFGLMGLEVYYPEHSQSMINFYKAYADEHGLLATGGSDCHGSAKPQPQIGSMKIPYSLVERLKEAKEKLQ